MEDRNEEIEASWRANAGAWVEAIRDELIEGRRVATNQAILDAALDRRPGRVLDVGCGEGWLSHRVAGQGADVTGFDSNVELVEHASAGPGTFLRLDYDSFAADPTRAGGPYDLAICNFSLLGRNIGPVLRGCREVLVEDGALVIQTSHPFATPLVEPYEDGWRREDFAVLEVSFPQSMPWYFRTMGSWLKELLAAGFTPAEMREPIHPESGRPLSLILVGQRSVQRDLRS